MRLRPLLLLGVTLALTLAGSALAGGNRTLTCSATSAVAGCFIEQPVWVAGDFEVAVGVDAQAAWAPDRASFLAPYAIVGYYGPAWSAWFEFAIPESRVPVIGKPDPWRVGFRWRF